MSDAAASIALYGSIVTTVGGIIFAIVKYLQWDKQNTTAYKDLEKRVSNVERTLEDHVDDTQRMINDCEKDAKEYKQSSKDAIEELTEWIKWMFDNAKKR